MVNEEIHVAEFLMNIRYILEIAIVVTFLCDVSWSYFPYKMERLAVVTGANKVCESTEKIRILLILIALCVGDRL